MGCAPILNLLQRARQLGRTEEEPDQEEHHSVQSLQASDEGEEHIPGTKEVSINGGVAESTDQRRQKVKWHASIEKVAWKGFDEDIDQMTETVLVGNAESILRIIVLWQGDIRLDDGKRKETSWWEQEDSKDCQTQRRRTSTVLGYRCSEGTDTRCVRVCREYKRHIADHQGGPREQGRLGGDLAISSQCIRLSST